MVWSVQIDPASQSSSGPMPSGGMGGSAVDSNAADDQRVRDLIGQQMKTPEVQNQIISLAPSASGEAAGYDIILCSAAFQAEDLTANPAVCNTLQAAVDKATALWLASSAENYIRVLCVSNIVIDTSGVNFGNALFSDAVNVDFVCPGTPASKIFGVIPPVSFGVLTLGNPSDTININLNMRNIGTGNIVVNTNGLEVGFNGVMGANFTGTRLNSSLIENCAFQKVVIDDIIDVDFKNCDITEGVVSSTAAIDVELFDCEVGQSGVIGAYNCSVRLAGEVHDVIVNGCALGGSSGVSGKYTAVAIAATSVGTRIVITDNWIASSGGGASSIVANDAGSITPSLVVAANNAYNTSAATKNGAEGEFDDSIFGPNAPDSLDYSGVTGTGNRTV